MSNTILPRTIFIRRNHPPFEGGGHVRLVRFGWQSETRPGVRIISGCVQRSMSMCNRSVMRYVLVSLMPCAHREVVPIVVSLFTLHVVNITDDVFFATQRVSADRQMVIRGTPSDYRTTPCGTTVVPSGIVSAGCRKNRSGRYRLPFRGFQRRNNTSQKNTCFESYIDYVYNNNNAFVRSSNPARLVGRSSESENYF